MSVSDWTIEEDKLASLLAKSGATRRDIAKRLGRNENSVKTRLRNLGIALRGEKNKWLHKLTAENVREHISYDPTTGAFSYVGLRNHAATKFTKIYSDRVYLFVCGKNYCAAHLAVLFMNGRWPLGEIAYNDHNFRNLMWANLVEVTRSQQNIRHGLNKNNTSGFKGVSWDSHNKMWFAKITHCRRQIYLGLFDSAELAHDAYCAAGVRLFGSHFNPGPTKERIEMPRSTRKWRTVVYESPTNGDHSPSPNKTMLPELESNTP